VNGTVIHNHISSEHWIPGDVPRPMPEVLTDEEVYAVLRCNGTKKIEDVPPLAIKRAMGYLRNEHGLRGFKGTNKKVYYRRADLLKWIEQRAKENPR